MLRALQSWQLVQGTCALREQTPAGQEDLPF